MNHSTVSAQDVRATVDGFFSHLKKEDWKAAAEFIDPEYRRSIRDKTLFTLRAVSAQQIAAVARPGRQGMVASPASATTGRIRGLEGSPIAALVDTLTLEQLAALSDVDLVAGVIASTQRYVFSADPSGRRLPVTRSILELTPVSNTEVRVRYDATTEHSDVRDSELRLRHTGGKWIVISADFDILMNPPMLLQKR